MSTASSAGIHACGDPSDGGTDHVRSTSHGSVKQESSTFDPPRDRRVGLVERRRAHTVMCRCRTGTETWIVRGRHRHMKLRRRPPTGPREGAAGARDASAETLLQSKTLREALRLTEMFQPKHPLTNGAAGRGVARGYVGEFRPPRGAALPQPALRRVPWASETLQLKHSLSEVRAE
jgi:hypothetical protein